MVPPLREGAPFQKNPPGQHREQLKLVAVRISSKSSNSHDDIKNSSSDNDSNHHNNGNNNDNSSSKKQQQDKRNSRYGLKTQATEMH